MRLEYIGEPDRVYPTLGIKPDVGEVYELPFGPEDGRWKVPGEDVPAVEDHPEVPEVVEAAADVPEPTESAPAETEHQE